MPHYRYHVFFCTHDREDGSQSCRGQVVRDYAKQRIKSLKLENECRINSAGCMGRCAEGPLLVIYPQGIWYTYVDEQDIDEIIDEHVCKHHTVERLRIPG
uniref:Putative ferredoxin / thioredoxin n=1 Tax=mine drainage metagenome TaxID=410659 RepID=E6QR42_9ZZZZ